MRSPAPTQCPHLGKESDPFSRSAHASDAHRCYAHLGRDRVDLSHQRRFCMTSAHAQCPFLLIDTDGPKRDWLAEARAGWRTVSPARPALTAAQLGAYVELGLAAARIAVRASHQALVWMAHRSVALAQLALQTWRTMRPHAQPGVVVAPEPVQVAVAPEPVQVAVAPEPVHMAVAPEPVQMVVAPEPVHMADAPEPVQAVVAPEPVREVVAPAPAPVGVTALDWFWRAKNAETLDELIDCLERACKLEPDNEMLSANLALAMSRRDLARESEKAARAARRAAEGVSHRPLQRRPSLAARLGQQLFGLVRVAAAIGAFGVAATLLLNALPPQLRSAASLPELPLPALGELLAIVHLPLAGGYDAASALPYAIGFMALFAGVGLLQPQTRP